MFPYCQFKHSSKCLAEAATHESHLKQSVDFVTELVFVTEWINLKMFYLIALPIWIVVFERNALAVATMHSSELNNAAIHRFYIRLWIALELHYAHCLRVKNQVHCRKCLTTNQASDDLRHGKQIQWYQLVFRYV